VTNVTNINNVVGTTKTVAAAQGQKTVTLDTTARAQVHKAAQATHQELATNRRKLETPPATGPITAPRTNALKVPATPTVGSGGLPKTPAIPTAGGKAPTLNPLDPKGKGPILPETKGVPPVLLDSKSKAPILPDTKGKAPILPDTKGKAPILPDTKGKAPSLPDTKSPVVNPPRDVPKSGPVVRPPDSKKAPPPPDDRKKKG
jgi:hypothetical protein